MVCYHPLTIQEKYKNINYKRINYDIDKGDGWELE